MMGREIVRVMPDEVAPCAGGAPRRVRSLGGMRPAGGIRRWALVAWLGAAIGAWRRRARGRRDLASLDDRALRDLKLRRSDVESASVVSYWRKRER